jgi:hypothetical protein
LTDPVVDVVGDAVDGVLALGAEVPEGEVELPPQAASAAATITAAKADRAREAGRPDSGRPDSEGSVGSAEARG